MKTFTDGEFDAVVTDPPYGTTACKWDTVIPFEPMWKQLERITKPRAAIVLFGSQPFTSALVVSKVEWFKYEWVWDKQCVTNFVNVKKQPLRQHENILIFSRNDNIYNPHMTGKALKPFGKVVRKAVEGTQANVPYTGGHSKGYPKSILRFARPNNLSDGGYHPTQKPVALMEYLIRTYTNEGDTVLDFAMGSGTTLVACHRTGRRGVGIDNDTDYYDIARKRVAEAQAQPLLL